MANGHGGYRKPNNPAPVSGPGKYSKRTDGGPAQVMSSMGDQAYGQRSADMAAQRVAPMGGKAPMPPAAAPGGGQGGQDAPPMPTYGGGHFGAPSERPDEPITHGIASGPGGGPEVLSPGARTGESMPDGQVAQLIRSIAANGDATGTLADLLIMAQQRGV